MRTFLKHIPGFRSGINYKKVIAIIYYLLVLLMLIASPAVGIFLLAAPFLVFSFIDLIRHKKKAIPLQKALIPLIISFALIITSLSVMPKTEPADRSSPAPSETEQVDDSGGESEPVVENRTDDANNKETPRPDTSDKVENPKEAPTENPTEKPPEKPTPEPTEEIKPTPKPTDKPTDPPTIEQKVYVGSTQSNKYHKPTCRHAKNIKPENEIWFDSANEAILNRYEPCGVCKPPR